MQNIKVDFSSMQSLLADVLAHNADYIGNYPAIISNQESLTHFELYDYVLKAENKLKDLYIQPGTKIALLIENPIKHLVLSLALFNVGAIQLSLNPKDVIYIQQNAIEQTQMDLVIQDIALENHILPNTLFISSQWDWITDYYKPMHINDNIYSLNDHPCIFVLGSGTTGTPKIILLESSTMAHQIRRDFSIFTIKPTEKVFSYSELYFHTPKRRMICALLHGQTLLLPKKKPKNIVSFCLQHKVDHLLLTGSQAIILLEQEYPLPHTLTKKLPNLKTLLVASSLVTEPVRKKLLAHISKKLFIHYGTNEFGHITAATPDELIRYSGTVGRALPDVDLLIVNDQGDVCPQGVTGNILIKSAYMMKEYFNNPVASKASFSDMGYLPGDIGKLTKDGNLIFEGRKDDMMIYSGVNIYPRELESILDSHPDVLESAVFPISINSHSGIPVAVVAVRKQLREQVLIEWCNTRLGWRKPYRIFFAKALPRNATGKVLKRILAKDLIHILRNKTL